MTKRKRGWITLPIRFYIDAESDEIFKKAVDVAKTKAWLSINSSEGYSVDSESARPRKFKKNKEIKL